MNAGGASGNGGAPGVGGVPATGGAGGQPPVAHCPDGMALVPGGTFEMAQKAGSVTVADLCVDRLDVTSDEYASCAACDPAATGQYCNAGVASRGSDPANCVSYNQASFYCEAASKRLPTEEEWEWAARGGPAANLYPWGNATPTAADSPAWLCWSAARDGSATWPGRPSGTCPAGFYPAGANPFGLLDMSGNVWQWTNSEMYPDGSGYITRGGGWDNTDPSRMTVGFRNGPALPTFSHYGIGFRCVVAPTY